MCSYVPVNLDSRRVPPGALGDVSVKDRAGFHVLQTELTEELSQGPSTKVHMVFDLTLNSADV